VQVAMTTGDFLISLFCLDIFLWKVVLKSIPCTSLSCWMIFL